MTTRLETKILNTLFRNGSIAYWFVLNDKKLLKSIIRLQKKGKVKIIPKRIWPTKTMIKVILSESETKNVL